jgi:hypothetical protein
VGVGVTRVLYPFSFFNIMIHSSLTCSRKKEKASALLPFAIRLTFEVVQYIVSVMLYHPWYFFVFRSWRMALST